VNTLSDILKKTMPNARTMKTITLIALIFLSACVQVAVEKNETNLTAPAQPNVTVQDILNEFEALDAQHNTSWMKEQIPKSMISVEALRHWTDQLITLKNFTAKDSLAYELIEARLEMLSAQTAVYLGAQVGEKGSVPFTRSGENVTIGALNCTNMKEIARATKLYQVSFHSWQRFAGHMDTVLQFDMTARNKLGVDDKRMPFYQSSFQGAREKIRATAEAAKEQCGVQFNLEPEPEIPKNLPRFG
jgi:hypothetical protein